MSMSRGNGRAEGISSLRECLRAGHFEALMAATRPTNRPDCRWLPRSALQKGLLHGLEAVLLCLVLDVGHVAQELQLALVHFPVDVDGLLQIGEYP